MKKLFLLMVTVCLAVAVNAATPEQLAGQSLRMENKRVGGTLTEEQQAKIEKIYLDFNSAEYADAAAKRKENGVVNIKVQEIMTPEQIATRIQYFKDSKAKRDAAKKQ